MPNAMLLGQAAGTAAALCISTGLLPKDFPIKDLQKVLRKDGMFLD
jgi:hypothetical protein